MSNELPGNISCLKIVFTDKDGLSFGLEFSAGGHGYITLDESHTVERDKLSILIEMDAIRGPDGIWYRLVES